jgi:hypothetical protein
MLAWAFVQKESVCARGADQVKSNSRDEAWKRFKKNQTTVMPSHREVFNIGFASALEVVSQLLFDSGNESASQKMDDYFKDDLSVLKRKH